MTIDVQQILSAAKPWDLKLTLDSIDQPVRRLAAADFKRLSDMAKYDEASNHAFLAGLFTGFDGQRPDPAAWDTDTASAVIAAIVAYYQDAVIRKNYEVAQQHVAKLLKR